MRIYAVLTGIFTFVHIFVIPEYERGAAEKKNLEMENASLKDKKVVKSENSNSDQNFIDDLVYMFKVKSYSLSNFAFAAVSCVTECGMVYFVEILRRYFITLGKQKSCSGDTKDYRLEKMIIFSSFF